MAVLKLAMERLPRVDAIGGSAAGIYIDSRAMMASLFRGIPEERMAAAGFSKFHPIDPAETSEAYRINRRIEIKLTSR